MQNNLLTSPSAQFVPVQVDGDLLYRVMLQAVTTHKCSSEMAAYNASLVAMLPITLSILC
jgi:hypothetical protein